MKKILYIVNIGKKVNNFSYSSMIAAQKEGFEFHIAGNWYGYNSIEEKEIDEKKYAIKIHQIDFIRKPYDLRNFRAYIQICRLIKKEKYDVIHCNTPIGGVVGRIAGLTCGVNRVIYQVHGFHFFKGASLLNWMLYYPIEKILSRITDCLITINDEDYHIAKRMKLKKNGSVKYVPGVGIDLKEFNEITSVNENKREELGIPSESIVMISLGELNDNKNIGIIIEAMKTINNYQLHYIVCGEGELRKDLEEKVKKYGLSENVHFLGFRDDIKDLLQISDIFVMPSKREGLSRALMEAMASGLPCVVSKIRGNIDLVREQKNGFLCDTNCVDDYSKSINILCDENKRKMYGEKSKELIKKFDINTVIENMRMIYRNKG